MSVWRRPLVPLAVAALCAFPAASALARTGHRPARPGPLSGTWSGTLWGEPQALTMTIVINNAQTGGSWSLGASCHGPLTLDNISGGYHHYLRHAASGTSCTGAALNAVGDIDCLKRNGAAMYDAVTLKSGSWNVTGTLRRVTNR